MSSEKWLIDANVFESDIQKMFVPYGDGTYPNDKNAMIYDEALVDVLEALNKAPTVDAVEVVHARWETQTDGTHFCTHCGCDAPYKWDDIDRSFINSADDVPDRPSYYCPNCGAKMDGGNEDG